MAIRELELSSISAAVNAGKAPAAQGWTQPWYGVATDRSTRERVQIVLKLCQVVPNFPPPGLMLIREVICSLILKALGFNVAEPFVVKVKPGTAALIAKRNPQLEKALENPPVHFASQRLVGFADFQPGEKLTSDTHIEQGTDLFMADNLFLNKDRRYRGKTNLMYSSKHLVPIDHGLAFSLITLPPRLPHDCLPAVDQVEHVVYPSIRNRKSLAIDRVLNNWAKVFPSVFWDQVEADLPTTWKSLTTDFDIALAHLRAHETRLSRIENFVRAVFPK